MRIVLKCLLVALASVFTACPAQEPVTVGKLEVKISGLPSGTNANVDVTGPASFKQALTGTKTLTGLTAGSYTVSATNVPAGGKNYGASITGSPAAVTAGGNSSVGVVYGALRSITGKLINGGGQPITAASLSGPGATLSIKLLGGTASTTIDATGAFTLTDVPATYSLAVLVSVTSGRFATVYQGLTRANPTLTMFQGPGGLSDVPTQFNFASAQGKFTGGLGFNAASKASTVFTVAVPKAVRSDSFNSASADATTGEYFASISWLGGNPVTATIHTLQYTNDTNGKINAYGGYAQKTINAVPNQTTPINQDIALLPITTGNVKGSVAWPSGLTAPEYQVNTTLLLNGSSLERIDLYQSNGTPPTVSVAPTGYDQLVPLITGAKWMQRASINEKSVQGSFSTRIESTVWKSLTPGTTTDIAVPVPIGLTSPNAAASEVTGSTKFSWSNFVGGVHVLSFFAFPGSTGVQTTFTVVTAASSTTIPDLSPYGFGVPKATIYLWSVLGVAPYSSLDAATDTNGLTVPYSAPLVDSSYSSSSSRSFTTAAK